MLTSSPGSSTTPPSELIRPPSKAAVIFLPIMLARKNGSIVSSAAAGMADSAQIAELVSAAKLYTISDSYVVPVRESLLCDE